MIELADHMEKFIEVAIEAEGGEEAFTGIQSLEMASGFMRGLARIRARIATNNATADADIAKVEQWVEDANKSLTNRAAFYEGHLEAFMRQERRRDPKTKSITLPAGTIKTTATKGTVEIDDPTAFFEWASADEVRAKELLRIVPETIAPDKNALKKLDREGAMLVTDEGELVPGVSVGPDSISVTVVTE